MDSLLKLLEINSKKLMWEAFRNKYKLLQEEFLPADNMVLS